MSACEKCWTDAGRIAAQTDVTAAEAYEMVLLDRKRNPCTPEEQAGQWWDPINQVDTRKGAVPASKQQ